MDDAFVGNMMEEMSAAANAASGGASASGSQTVVTGNSSASVQVTNVINADNSGGTSHTIIEKSIDGVKEVIEETKHFDPGEPVIVETTVEANSGGEHTHTAGEDHTEDASEDTTKAASSTEEETASQSSWSLSGVFSAVTGFFSTIFSWW